MKLFGLDIQWAKQPVEEKAGVSLDTLIRRLEAAFATISGIAVTPETAMESSTVQAIVKAISARISTLSVDVFEKKTSNGQTSKEPLPNHPVARLLKRPNDWQTATNYWADAASWLVRYGNFYAFMGRGVTGPIRRLEPIFPASIVPEQDEELNLLFRVTRSRGDQVMLTSREIHHARGPARNGLVGDSPVMDARESIALEIAVEKFGASFFGNGALPSLIFQFVAGAQGFKTDEEREQFMGDFQEAYSGRGRFRAMLMPKGIEIGKDLPVDNEKAQFLQTRKYQRTVIAGAFGVPPHLVGDLEKGTFNNVEQQSLDFVQNVVLPYVKIFESAMERDLLTDEDRRGGIIIRFNLDAALRADFKTRQEGLKIQRESGVISPNEWREKEGLNPREGGDEYWEQGPSGQNASGASSADAQAGSSNGSRQAATGANAGEE